MSARAHEPRCVSDHVDRRSVLALLALGTLGVLEACSGAAAQRPRGGPSPAMLQSMVPGDDAPRFRPAEASLGPIPPPRPGRPAVITQPPKGSTSLALTIDDGTCADCVAAYVDFAERTGISITFSPNGVYRDIWEPHASRLRPLIAASQVQIGNHTWAHKDLTRRSDRDVSNEITQNERWIEDTFGITARPWLRPPFGKRDRRTDAIAAGLGYTRVVMWNGSLGDAVSLTPDVLLQQANRYLQPGTIVLGHANHPTVTRMFDQLEAILAARRLVPVTLDTMFGTSRATG